jgi:hypothetical protein
LERNETRIDISGRGSNASKGASSEHNARRVGCDVVSEDDSSLGARLITGSALSNQLHDFRVFREFAVVKLIACLALRKIE